MTVRALEQIEMHCSRGQYRPLQRCQPSERIPEGQAGRGLSGGCLVGLKHQTGPVLLMTWLQLSRLPDIDDLETDLGCLWMAKS